MRSLRSLLLQRLDGSSVRSKGRDHFSRAQGVRPADPTPTDQSSPGWGRNEEGHVGTSCCYGARPWWAGKTRCGGAVSMTAALLPLRSPAVVAGKAFGAVQHVAQLPANQLSGKCEGSPLPDTRELRTVSGSHAMLRWTRLPAEGISNI